MRSLSIIAQALHDIASRPSATLRIAGPALIISFAAGLAVLFISSGNAPVEDPPALLAIAGTAVPAFLIHLRWPRYARMGIGPGGENAFPRVGRVLRFIAWNCVILLAAAFAALILLMMIGLLLGGEDPDPIVGLVIALFTWSVASFRTAPLLVGILTDAPVGLRRSLAVTSGSWLTAPSLMIIMVMMMIAANSLAVLVGLLSPAAGALVSALIFPVTILINASVLSAIHARYIDGDGIRVGLMPAE